MRSKILLSSFCALVVAAGAHAKLVTKSVAYEHDGVKLEGYLAYDDSLTSGTKLPGVLVVHEWWGLNDYIKDRTRQLAEQGVVAFALDMYGRGVRADSPQRANELASQFYGKPLMAQRARAGLEQLRATGLVADDKIAAIGFCFGGATVQQLAYSGADLAGIVSFHGSLTQPEEGQGDQIKARFLICHGAADTFISDEEKQGFLKALDEAEVDYQFIIYADAVHAFTNPGADETARKTGLKGIGYHEAAARRAWAHMEVFFTELFDGGSR